MNGAFPGFTDAPGFSSDDGSLVLGDIISLEFLESETHGGFLQYHDGTSLQSGFNYSIHVDGKPGTAVELFENSFSGTDPDIGEVRDQGGSFLHDHVDFTLDGDPGPAFGAYGVLAKLKSDNPIVVDSDPFWIVFNYGLVDEEGNHTEAFEKAVGDISGVSAIPEPATGALAVLATLGVLYVRRRK